MITLSDLDKKTINVETLAQKALANEMVLSELLEGILSNKDTIRYNSFKVLLHISEQHPKAIYPKWKYFADLLTSDNSYKRLIAIRLIANLTPIDTEHKFETIFDTYYNTLDEKQTMTAAHLAGNSGKIAKAKPHLQTKITNKLINIDTTHRGKQKELIKGYAIEAFNEYFTDAKDKKKILEFVTKQLQSKSPRTKKLAKQFLTQWKT
jgi:hypothetical protein